MSGYLAELRRNSGVIKEFFLVLGLLIAATVIINRYSLDIRVQSLFYATDAGWYLSDIPLFRFLHSSGEKIWIVPFSISVVLLMLSLAGCIRIKTFRVDIPILKRLTKYRVHFVFVILLAIIGPGLVVNSGLKDNLGRPRPREVVEFGGNHEFIMPWVPGDSGKNSSFPSGHAAAAFYMMFPFFLLRRKNTFWAFFSLIAGMGFGIVMGLSRVAQGAHFLSDVMWSGGIVYLTGLLLYYLLGLRSD